MTIGRRGDMFTILGASGFIGSRLASALRAAGAEVATPARGDDLTAARDLGHVIDCVGVTSDFRTRPLDAVEAHVARLLPLLRDGRFRSLLYLSSTRVYRGQGPARESDVLEVSPERADDLYNLTKLAGEAACLAAGRETVRVVRLSNVYGAGMARDNFLAAVIGEAVGRGHIVLQTASHSTKDYVCIDDVVALLPRIAMSGRHRIYNLAAGRNVSHGEIAAMLAKLTSCRVMIAEDAPRIAYPAISIERIASEFGFVAATLEDRLPELVRSFHERTVAA
ncbi:MAG TPA: NAD(P)-dependent oxidoreductase [Alphaproteobacteria bacterium]|nr:NAD(P)-dependent oxidoreductase [Alphaproteobacteria bacterium]